MSIWSAIKKAYTTVVTALGGNKTPTPSPVPAGMVGTPTTTGAAQPIAKTPTTTPTNPQPTVTTTPTTTGTTPKTTTTTSGGGSSPAVTQPAAQPQATQPQTQPAAQPQTSQAQVEQPAQSYTSSSTSTTPTTTSQSQYRQAQVKNPDGTTTPTWIDKNKSYIGQTGQYEFNFWTGEGQAERLKNALDTATLRFGTSTAIGGNYVPVASEATTALIDALNVATILNGGVELFNFIKGAAAVGEVVTTGGPALVELAGNIPEASAIAPEVVAATEVVSNTKNWLTTLKYIGTVAKAVKTPVIAVGILASLITTKVAVSQAGRVAVGNDLSTFNDKWLSHAQDLRGAGMTDMADELATCAQDVKDALDSGAYNNVFNGKRKGLEAVNACNAQLAKDLDTYNARVSADAKAKIAEAQAADQQAADLKRQQDLADLADKRAYDAATLADKRAYDEAQAAKDAAAKTATTQEQRAYNEQQTAEQRAYNEQQQAQSDQQAAGLEATATETSQPSTLTFGLLGTSGAKEFVDKDKAAQYYFGKSYDELTPAQQMLLNLLKGTGE
jgi:hypothetical protein